jgi:hypothetical protein
MRLMRITIDPRPLPDRLLDNRVTSLFVRLCPPWLWPLLNFMERWFIPCFLLAIPAFAMFLSGLLLITALQ